MRAARGDGEAYARGGGAERAAVVVVGVGGVVVAEDVVGDRAAHRVGDDPERTAVGVRRGTAPSAAVRPTIGCVDDFVGDFTGGLGVPVRLSAVVADHVVRRREVLGRFADDVAGVFLPVVSGSGVAGVGARIGLL